nr:uncharacterized protein LOC109737332 isoform X2 [Aegilops tauschii subsp. strangulata]
MTSEMHRWRSGRTPSVQAISSSPSFFDSYLCFFQCVTACVTSRSCIQSSEDGFCEVQVAASNMKRVITMLFTLNLRYKIIGICNWWFRSCCKEARRPAWQK